MTPKDSEILRYSLSPSALSCRQRKARLGPGIPVARLGPGVPGGALAWGGIGVLIPIYLGRGPGSTEGIFKSSTKLCGGDRERFVGGRDGPGMGGVAADSEGISKIDLNSVNALMSVSL